MRIAHDFEIIDLLRKYGVKPLPQESQDRKPDKLFENVDKLLSRGVRFDLAISILSYCMDKAEDKSRFMGLMAVSCALRAFSLSYAMTKKYFYGDGESIYNQRYARWKRAQLDANNILYSTPPPQSFSQIETPDDNKVFRLSLNEAQQKIAYLSQVVYICYQECLTDKANFNTKDIENIGWALLILWKLPNRVVSNLLPPTLKPEVILDLIESGTTKNENTLFGLRRYSNACLLMGRYESIPPKFGITYDDRIYTKGIKGLEYVSIKMEENLDLLIHICVVKSWRLVDFTNERKKLSKIRSNNFIVDIISLPNFPNDGKISYISLNNMNKKLEYNHDFSYLPEYLSFINVFLNTFWNSITKIISEFDDALLELIDDIKPPEKNAEQYANNIALAVDYVFTIFECAEIYRSKIDISGDLKMLEFFFLKRISANIDTMNTENTRLINKNKQIKKLLNDREKEMKIGRALLGM